MMRRVTPWACVDGNGLFGHNGSRLVAFCHPATHRSLEATVFITSTVAGCLGLVRRVRAMSGAQFVQTLVFAWLDHPDATSDDLAATAETLGVTITPQGFNAWFSDQSTACLQQVLQVAMVHIIDADLVAIPLVARFPAVWLHDSTVISLPAELAEQFRGCHRSHGAGTAALKAHLRLDISTGRVCLQGRCCRMGAPPTAPSPSASAPPRGA
jgi:hypothetical protein